ncbi:hypothetical protein C1H46_016534 [Malus baccata]|uniref:RRM domain-containing protein n=1 Tax=Malus baccata TaxID=106549 RepID=A0A540MHE8_MALBA|nr:hypothetical protein C1H46_016534 [Malus baccata]
MAHSHYRSQFGDTTFTKVFVGGLAWETPTDEMRRYFEQFGEILEAVIIDDKNTRKSKGYGFVTFRDPESTRRACANPNPVIGGRRANCNIASLGRPRPSPPRGYTVLRRSARFTATTNAIGSYNISILQHAMYNPQVYQQPQYYPQVYGSSPSSPMGTPYYYHGYSFQSPSPRGTFSSPQAHRMLAPSYLYYPTHNMEPSSSSYPNPPLLQPPATSRHNPPNNFTFPSPGN